MKGALLLGGLVLSAVTVFGQAGGEVASVESQRAMVDEYCVACHNDTLNSGGFSWTEVDLAYPGRNAEQAEKVIRMLRSGMMPPAGAPRPDPATLKGLASALETRVDAVAAQQPYIDAPELHRVNRSEYRNSVRDLLGLDLDVTSLLPRDASTAGFDNMADALSVTPALMQGYIRAAETISRIAVGDPEAPAAMVSYNVPKVYNQMRHIEGTPFGTRGGMAVVHNFPADGEYVFKLELYFWYTGQLIGSRLPDSLRGQELEVSVDGERVAVFTIDPNLLEPTGALVTDPIQIKAGPRRIAVAFVSKFDGAVEDQYWLIEQTLMDVSIAQRPGITALPHLQSVFITGPMNVTGVTETPSRRRIFTCHPTADGEEEACAAEIISRLVRQAFRRPVVAEDLEEIMVQYYVGHENGGFEGGIRTALQAILANPEFVFRFELVPAGVAPGESFALSDLELASRLSYFLWSSGPDDQLITLASQGKLKDSAVLDQQVKRMLADPRSETLATNFAGQWLRLRGIAEVLPEAGLFPNYTKNLGESMRREVELLFDSIVREDRSVLELLSADYTFVDEALARHYGIPNVLGSRFRRVPLSDPNRFGLLGKAGVLTMTSLANRTSPVARGKYVLEVLIGTPPPNPPEVVPPLAEAVDNQKVLSVRERMEQHRANPACSACHQLMDPIGLALENFGPTGAWRINDSGYRIDPSAEMYDGTELEGPVGLRGAILNRSEAFVGTFTENLLAYSLGRVLDYRDMPTVRSIARTGTENEGRFSAFVLATVRSPGFRLTRNLEASQ